MQRQTKWIRRADCGRWPKPAICAKKKTKQDVADTERNKASPGYGAACEAENRNGNAAVFKAHFCSRQDFISASILAEALPALRSYRGG